MKNNVTLRVTANDTLLAVFNNADYPEIPYNTPSWSNKYTKRSLIFAEGVKNIRITGGGVISGNGLNGAYLQTPKDLRPFGIRINNCDSITIDSIKLLTAPHWMVHIARSEDIYIHHVNIYNHGFGSNDGFNIDACQRVLIENCVIDSNDDPIVVKSHSEDMCRDVLVRNCELATFERGVKVGNESLGPFVNIRFEDIIIRESDFFLNLAPQTAIYLSIADGGSADSIYFERIQVNTDYDTPIFIRLCNRGNKYDSLAPPPPVQYLRNVLIKDVVASAGTTIPCSVTGIPGYLVENVRLENINLSLPGNGPIGETNQPELENTRPENDIWGNTLPSYGLYVRHVNGLVIDSFCVNLAQPETRPMFYYEDTANITGGNCINLASSIKAQKIANNLKLYPNPAYERLSIEGMPVNEEVYIAVHDALGKIHLQHWFNHAVGKATMNITSLDAGIYTLQIQTANGSNAQRFMVFR